MDFGFKLKGVGPPSYYLGGDFNIVNHVLQFGPMASYGSEMVAGKIAVEQTKEIRYVLRSIGVPFKGPLILSGKIHVSAEWWNRGVTLTNGRSK